MQYRFGKRKVGRGMRKRHLRANSMALYAAFLVTVGMPLLALGVDFSRVELMRVKLRTATQAACQAYANSLDIHEFQFNNRLVFTEGYANANNVFSRALGKSGAFGAVEERGTVPPEPIGGGKSVETIVIRCYGTGIVKAMIPFVGDYAVGETASAKTKFTTVGIPK
jgi:hypothetical protein